MKREWDSFFEPPVIQTGLDLCERGYELVPDRAAILYFDAAISYGHAEGEASALSYALRNEFHVAEGDRVALMMQNVPQMAISLHASWKAGGIVTPINVMNRRRELVHQLNDAEVETIICQEVFYDSVVSVMRDTPLKNIITVSELDYLHEIPPMLSQSERSDCPLSTRYTDLIESFRGAEDATSKVDPSSPALLSYTSGTTGLPKGAINTHRAVAHNAMVWRQWYELGPDDVVVAAAPLFHITGLMGHFAAARAAMAPLLLSYRFDAEEILRQIEKWAGTWVVAPLTAYVALLEHPDLLTRDLRSLTKAASGGAPVSASVADQFEATTGVYLHNAYGLTESTSAAILVPLGDRAPIDSETGALAIGMAVPGIELRIVSLEAGDQEVEIGESGELLIRGPMVVPGYWRNEEETARAIDGGWLRTGDVVKRNKDGWYWLIDRIKDMIITSGYKVWPREVEDVLYKHPAVSEAGVVGVPDDYSGERVIAYVVLKEGFEASQSPEIIAHCREFLAAYKVPRSLRLVNELPKTASGKVLRRDLRSLAGDE